MNVRRGLLFFAFLIIIAASLGGYWWFHSPEKSLHLYGVVESQEVHLGSKIGGRIAEVLVVEGQTVEANQILVRLEAPELRAQELQWQAKIEAAVARLQKARNGPRKEEKQAAHAAVEAAKAKLAKLKFGWRDEERQQAKAELEMASADYTLAVTEFDRVQRLFENKNSSRSELDTARNNKDRTAARLSSARSHNDMLVKGTRPEDIDEAVADLKRFQSQLELLEAGTRPEEIQEAQADLAHLQASLTETQANLAEAEVKAPGKASVEVVAVRKGDLAAPNQSLVRILRWDDLWVRVYVPETELSKVRLHEKVELTVDAYPERRFRGKIIQIASVSEFTPRNVQSMDGRRHEVFGVKVQIDDSSGIFKAGLAAEVFLPLHRSAAP